MPEYRSNGYRGPALLTLAVIACALLAAAMRDARRPLERGDGAVPVIDMNGSIRTTGDRIGIRTSGGGDLLVSSSMSAPFSSAGANAVIEARPDRITASRIMAFPLSLQWKHPKLGLPAAQVVRAMEIDAIGRQGPVATRTIFFQDHGELPIISLVMDHDDLFSADRGIMVVGNAILDADARAMASYARDPRWWKYPGNFMGRGKEWEREASMEMIDADGRLALTRRISVRINGQMTRGFPQHALRLIFKDPLLPWAEIEQAQGYSSMVLRAAGNDQVKAMMRDAYQHTLCGGLPFETSRAWPCVLYINGTYWGVHYLRERLDDDEIARRYKTVSRDITILEDAAVFYRGDQAQVGHFMKLVRAAEKREAGQNDPLRAALDVDGFLTYMAAQMILGNMDWPEQNVKFWRYTGDPRPGSYMDGRWYFAMGDSDLSFGAHASSGSDIFLRVRNSTAPIARLFNGLLKDPRYEELFREKAIELLDGPLSSMRMLEVLEEMLAVISPEMDRHTARWRKPIDRDAWEREVEVLREFASSREDQVRRQLEKVRTAKVS